LLQVKEQPDERDLHSTMDTVLIFDTMTGLRTEAEKYQTIKAADKKIRSENLTALRWHKIRYHLSKVIIRSTKS
jgi:hypothetical protein